MNNKQTYRKNTNKRVLKTAPKCSYANNSYYLGGLIMKGSKVEFINTAEGRALLKASLWTNPDSSIVNPAGDSSKYVYEYSLKDQRNVAPLSNLRVACRCADPVRDTTSGIILANVPREPVKAVQTEDYDAWGLAFGSGSLSVAETNLSKYKYNGKELVDDLEIGLYEYGFRWYDAQIAKFMQVDPLADDYEYKSTYDYAENSPIVNIDLDGLEKFRVGKSSEPQNMLLNENNHFEKEKKQSAGIMDGVKKAWWTSKAGGAYLFMPDASKAYLHYLYGEGKNFKFNLSKYLNEDESGKISFFNLMEVAKGDASELFTKPGNYSMNTDKFILGDGDFERLDVERNWLPYPDSENWQKAIGGFQMYMTAEVKVEKNKDKLKYTMNLMFHGSDLYNFNLGDADIATGVSDSVNGEFVIKNLAKQFKQYGEAKSTKPIVWEIQNQKPQ